jgi:phosphoglycolate phosphatase
MLGNGPLSTIFFDLDGTLIDHFQAIHRCYNHTLASFGLPPCDSAYLRRCNDPLPMVARHFLGSDDGATIDRFCQAYRAHMRETLLDGLEELPGARWLLRELHGRGYAMAILTNKQRHSAEKICEHIGFGPYLRHIIALDEGVNCLCKPHPDFCRLALEKMGARAETCAMVGDSKVDWETARAGNFSKSFFVTTGVDDAAGLMAAGVPRSTIFPNLHALGSGAFSLEIPGDGPQRSPSADSAA